MDCEEPAGTELPIIVEPWTDPSREWEDQIVPATIFQIQHAEDITDKKGFVIDGRRFGKVLVIAQVVAAEPGSSSASMSFKIEDGTGRISAWMNLTSVRVRQSAEQEEAERESCLALEGSFIETTAKIKRIRGRTSLTFETQPRRVRDFHQVLFHTLNAMFVHAHRDMSIPGVSHGLERMDISSAGSANPDPVIDSSAKSITPPTESASTSAHKVEPQVGTSRIPDKGKGSMQPYVHRDSILRSIIQIVRTKEKDAINGLVIRSDIQQNLQSQSAVTEEEFENAITYLIEEGYLTSPLDDDYVMITPRG